MAFDLSKQVQRQFSHAALSYARRADVQRRIAETLAAMLPNRIEGKRVLDIGCGSGFLTAHCLRKFPTNEILGVDSSAEMICRAIEALGVHSGLSFEQSDIFDYVSPSPFSLVVSSSVFHWLSPLEQLFKKIDSLLLENGRLMFSAMTSGTFAELQSVRAVVSPDKLARFQLPSLDAFLSALKLAGFSSTVVKTEKLSVSFPDAMSFIRELHDLGFNAGQGRLSRRELARLTEVYDDQYVAVTGGVYATYEVCFIESCK